MDVDAEDEAVGGCEGGGFADDGSVVSYFRGDSFFRKSRNDGSRSLRGSFGFSSDEFHSQPILNLFVVVLFVSL